jgi:fatty-acyl-CoA synthase/long-chain acyl-CoA synthetase
LAEVPNIATILPKAHHRPQDEESLKSAGFPATLVEIALFSDELDFDGQIGEVGIKAPYAVGEYLDGTSTHDSDGWIKTGDIGRIDDEGRLILLDRKQDIIITDGEPVYSTEVEDVIQRHPDVHQVAVIGILEELQEYCGEQLSERIVPESLDTVGKLPETAYGKIDKRLLKEPYW